MANQYSKIGSDLKPYTMPNDILLSMGRLVRAFAEIEDIANLHMCQVAAITEGQAMILLGRSSITQKLALMKRFADAIGGDAKALTAECFDNEAFTSMRKCRNVIAHGIFLGATEAGNLAFRTTSALDVSSDTVAMEVITYKPGDFELFAEMAEMAIPQIEGALQVTKPRAERRAQVLASHPKARPIRSPSSPHLRQRKPPRVKAKEKPRKGG